MKITTTVKLTQEGAMIILRGALDKAQNLGLAASVAVVDDGGHLLAFGRSEEAELYSVAISQAKARSAALTRFPSGKKVPVGPNAMTITPSPLLWLRDRVPSSPFPAVFRFW